MFLTVIVSVAAVGRCEFLVFPQPLPAECSVTHPARPIPVAVIHKEFKPCIPGPSVFLRVSLSVTPYKNLQHFLEGLLLAEGLKSPIFKMIPYGSPSASWERLLTNVLSSLQIHFWQEATRVSFIKALHITLYAHSYCRHFWAAINLCDRNHSSFLQMTSSNCWVLFSTALHLSWSYPVTRTPTSSISSSCPGELMWQQWKAVEN